MVAAEPRRRPGSPTRRSTTWTSANASPSAGTAPCATGRAPLTLAWGLHDPVARTAVLDGLRELRPGVEAIELPEAGHYPQIEQPELISAALDTALGRAG